MSNETFQRKDIAAFLKLAAVENWVAEQWEFDFLLDTFPQGCFSARDDSGEAIAFVTSLRHGRSGWIGNLIVAGAYRGRGIGEALFAKAFETLRAAGAQTVWLTASKAGQSLYEKYGFRSVDTIIRWVGVGRCRRADRVVTVSAEKTGTALLSSLDTLTWGDRRETLLAVTTGRGRVLQRGAGGFTVIQKGREAQQLGPFSALDSFTAEQLVDEALRSVSIGTRVIIDAPASNRAALRLFNRRRMKISGRNELMYAGIRPDYRPELLYGLATMGSCG